MSFYPTKGETPQGGIISPTLMNMALDGLQSLLERRFPSTAVQGRKAKIHPVRYADDFVITGATPELLRNDVMPIVIDFLAERGLMLSPEKTRIVNIKQGFDFLGQNIRKYKGKLLIKPSRMNLKNFLHKIRSIIEKNKASPAWLLISHAKSRHSGMGKLSSSCSSKENVPLYCSSDMVKSVAMVCETPSKER